MNQKDIEINDLKEKLLLSERRYEIAMGFSDVTVFDYNVVTKTIITQHEDFEVFGIHAVLDNGVEDLIDSAIIAKRSHEDMRNLYKKIDNGEPSAKAIVYAYDVNGHERVIEILLVTIFNKNNEPKYAIGVRKDITESQLLKKENAYKRAIAANTILTYEANITADRFISYNKEWFEEQGITNIGSVDQTIKYICDNVVVPEQREFVFNKISNDAVVKAYQEGNRLISSQYLRLVKDGVPEWFENTIHIIKDDLTDDINVRCYVKNINEEKEKEKKALEEQHYFESMVSKSDAAYEFNYTRDLIVSGHDNWNKLFGVELTNNYSEMMTEICKKAIHPHDREGFRAAFSRESILHEYEMGIREIVHEYRRPDMYGEFIWVSSSIHLFEDVLNGDIKGYVYVRSIDTQKKEQLKLIYRSQRDTLTGCYNKATVADKITDYLSMSGMNSGSHAFFILDLDYFKAINDNFGHAFGDVFLSKTAHRIKALFREDDIVGRIGGDEFVVFMKNIQDEKAVCMKAAELCSAISETYTQSKKSYHVSLSIGVAIYRKHGKTYNELYHNSDTALYYAKGHGRNQYAVFNDTMKFGSTNIKAIDSARLLQAKIFEENISEYVFRILYEASDKKVAINSVLELIGKHYEVSRVYIYECSEDGTIMNNTFEWCDEGIASCIGRSQVFWNMPDGDYSKRFNEDGYFFMADSGQASPVLQNAMERQGVKSILQFSITRKDQLAAYIGFDECKRMRVPKQSELIECRNMTNVIGIFITEMRAIEKATAARLASDASRQMALSIVNGLGSYAYVCDPNTHEVLFVNDRLQKLIPDVKLGDVCYQAFWAKDEVCEGCPLKALVDNQAHTYDVEMYNSNLKMWVKATTTWIDWIDREKACLVDSVDITNYIKRV